MTLKQAMCPPAGARIKKMRVCIHTRDYYPAKKKKAILPPTTWMDHEGITASEISQRKTNTT